MSVDTRNKPGRGSLGSRPGNKPLQRAWLNIQCALGFLVRGAAEPGPKTDGFGAKGRECRFLSDPGGGWGAGRAREGGEPYALGCRVGVDDIVRAGSAFECCRRHRG